MKDFFIIESADKIWGLRLVSVRPQDGERLRRWKNAHRKYFFYREIISRVQQNIWMEKYFSDIDNYMFTIKYHSQAIGCMGFRRLPDGADIYNVILAHKEFARKGLMGKALRLLCGFIRQCNIERIYLKVLKSNIVAQRWYQKSHFKKTKVLKDAFIMEFQGQDIEPVRIKTIKEGM